MNDLKDVKMDNVEINVKNLKDKKIDTKNTEFLFETSSDSSSNKFKKNQSYFDYNKIDNQNFEHNHISSNEEDNNSMNKFIKEQNIYSDPKDYYKRRTIIINKKQGSFGFDIQVCYYKICVI